MARIEPLESRCLLAGHTHVGEVENPTTAPSPACEVTRNDLLVETGDELILMERDLSLQFTGNCVSGMNVTGDFAATLFLTGDNRPNGLIEVGLRPNLSPGLKMGTLILFTDSSGQGIELILKSIIPVPEISVTIDGGEVFHDGAFRIEDNALVEITNKGKGLLELSSIDLFGDFKIGANPMKVSLPQGGKVSLSVARNPGPPGDRVGLLSISSNDPVHPEFGIELESIVTSVRKLYIDFDGEIIERERLLEWSSDWSSDVDGLLDADQNGISVEPLYQDDPNRETLIDRIFEIVEFQVGRFNLLPVRLPPNQRKLFVATEGLSRVMSSEDTSYEIEEGSTVAFVGNNTVSRRSHIASDIDLDDNNLIDLAFVLPEDWGYVSGSNPGTPELDITAAAIARVILHEAGHTYGLKHVEAAGVVDVMQQRKVDGERFDIRLLDASFESTPFDIVAEDGLQNSFSHMVSIFGVAPVDPTPPLPPLAISVPFGGDTDYDADVDLIDFLKLARNLGRKDDPPVANVFGDFNVDGRVDFSDFLILSANFGTSPKRVPTHEHKPAEKEDR